MKRLYLLIIILYCQIGKAQYTTIPDVNFEQELIDQGIDSDLTINGQILTSDINSITSLILNNATTGSIVNFTGIEGFVALQELFFSANSLQIINLSNNINLKKIILADPQISNINISSNLALEYFSLAGANNITTIDVSNNANLKELRIGFFNLAQLDVSNNINLEILSLKYTLINQIDLSQNTLLKKIQLGENQFSSIDVTHNTILKELDVFSNSLTNLNVNQNPLLEVLHCGNNLITSLNLNNNPLLNVLSCNNYIGNTNNNYLTSIYLQNGSNTLLNGVYNLGEGGTIPIYLNRFDSTNNPNLHCIFVDDVTNCNSNWPGKDSTSSYVSTQQECNNLGNETFIINDEITIYPNPTNGILNINSNINSITKVIIYDILGKVVLERSNNFEQLNISNLTNGLYLVKISTENKTVVKKIMKK